MPLRLFLHVLLLWVLPAAAQASLNVRVLSAVGESVPDAAEKRVLAGTPVTLHLAVGGEKLPLVSSAASVHLDGRRRKARPPASLAGTWRVRWYRVEPIDRALSNTDPSFHWHEIRYRDVPIEACDDRFTCPAEIRTSVLGNRGGLGTMTFTAEVSLDGRSGRAPGSEKLWRGGLRSEVARVTVRRDDTYLGLLTELFNTPYIWGSAGDDAVHQTERRIGSDCADLMTYGVRRLGHDVPYTSTWQLPRYTRRIAASQGPSDDGIYRTDTGEVIPIGEKGARPGDLLLFSGHVGALVRDEPPLGVLSASDVMIHTSWREPEEAALADTEYARAALQVMRWKVLEKR